MLEILINSTKDRSLPTDTRHQAMAVLVKLFKEESFSLFTSLLNNENEPMEIRAAAALALGKYGERSLDILHGHFNSDNPALRNYVVQAIGMTGESGTSLLIKALSDSDNEVFYSAANAIGNIGKDAVPYLTALLDSGEPDAKCIAAWKLGEIQDVSAASSLIQVLRNNKDNEDVIALATWALGEVSRKNKNNKSIISALYKTSRTKNHTIKQHAFVALRKARDYLN